MGSIALVILLAVSLVVSGTPFADNIDQEPPYTFDDVFDPLFYGASVQAEWISGTNSLTYYDIFGTLVLHNVDTNEIEELVPPGSVVEPSHYALSPDGLYVAFKYDHKYFNQEMMEMTERVSVFDIAAGVMSDYPNDDAMRGQTLIGFQWANTGHASTFVYNMDIYYQATLEAVPSRLTDTGAPSNGHTRNGFWFWNDNFGWNHPSSFSPDDGHLVIGESVFSADFPESGHPIYGDTDSAYYRTYMQNYVKANPEYFSDTHIYVVDMVDQTGNTRIELFPPQEISEGEYYNMQIRWIDNDNLAVTWGTRAQNELYIMIYNITAGTEHQNFQETVEGGWNHNLNMIRLFSTADQYVSILSRDIGDLGGYKQVALVDIDPAAEVEGEVTYLTNLPRDVWWVVGVSEAEGFVYYTGVNNDPIDRHLFRVTIPEAGVEPEEPVCMTCGMAPECDYVSASFSDSTEYYILSCLGPDVPKYYLRSTISDDLDMVLEDNQALRELLASKDMPLREFMSIEYEEGFVGWAEIIYPSTIIPGMQYPVLMYPYNGPHNAQQVTKAYGGGGFFGSGYENYLASSENIVTVRIDGRGTGMNGDRFMYSVYKQLGVLETRDQIFGVQDVIARFDKADLDPNRIAVYGHSYGGFMAGSILSDSSNVVTCGLASAPVVSWRWYSAIYTERYQGLDTVEDNAAGYANSSLINKVDGLRGKLIMITHGTHDDNVHVQNAMQWLKVLARGDHDYISYIYADENHYLINVLHHEARMFTRMLKTQCFPEETVVESGASSIYSPTTAMFSMLLLVGWKFLESDIMKCNC